MKKNKYFIYFIILGSLLVSSLLLFTSDPYYGHDIGFHLSRIQSIADCLRNGSFPAIIYPEYFNGYGYANGVFYPDLFLYIPGFMVFLGLDCKIAYNIFLFIINVATLFSMYFCIKTMTGNDYVSSIISCIYLLCTYRITDLYVRSALGETLCFIFVPLVVLGVYQILYKDYAKGYYLMIGLFGVLSSHILTLLFCVIFIVSIYLLYLFNNIKDTKQLFVRTKYLFIYCLLSIGVCAYFLFPFLEMYISDTFYFQSAPATGGWDRTIPIQLSLIEIPTYRDPYFPLGIGLSFLIMICFIIRYFKDTDNFFRHVFFLGVIFLLLTTNIFPWKIFESFAKTIQFPWRFMIIAVNCLLFAFSGLSEKLSNKKMINFMLLCSLAFSLICSAADIYIIHDPKLYEEDIHYSVGGAEYVPDSVNLDMIQEKGQTVTSNNDINISYERNGKHFIVDYSNNKYDNTSIELPLIYYKGYKASENNSDTKVNKSPNGLLSIDLSQSEGVIDVYYGFTPIRITGYIVCGLSLLTTILINKKMNS